MAPRSPFWSDLRGLFGSSSARRRRPRGKRPAQSFLAQFDGGDGAACRLPPAPFGGFDVLEARVMFAAPEGEFGFDTATGTITSYLGAGGAVVIPATIGGLTVTGIGQTAFYGNAGLTSLSLPPNLTTIGSNAFNGCTGLTSLTLPAGVMTISTGAFNGCTGLTSLSLPTNLTTIGSNAFVGCSGLTSLTLPAGVTTIGAGAFAGCTGLTSLTLPAGVTTIGGNAFLGCFRLTSLYFLGNAPPSVGTNAFGGVSAQIYYLADKTGWTTAFNGLTAVSVDYTTGDFRWSISNGAVTITSYTGSGGAVTIPDTIFGLPVTGIGSKAFFNKATLTSLSLPTNLTTIGTEAFSGCTGLTSLSLPTNLTTIGNNAFQRCTGLTSLSLPTNLTTIGAGAFVGCTGLTSLSLPTSLTTIGTGAFLSCTGLKSLSLPTNLTTIGINAFRDCSGLTSLTLPTNLTTIGLNAFSLCTGLTSLTIPAGVTTIGNVAFNGCTSLTSLYFLGNAPPSVSTDAFLGVSATISYLTGTTGWTTPFYGLTAVSVASIAASSGDFGCSISNGAVTITEYTGSGGAVTIPDTIFGLPVTGIGSNAFLNKTALTSLTLPTGVTTIGDYAFYGCTGLTSLSLPTNLTTIGNSAFRGCSGLTSLSLPTNLTTIGGNAFYLCTGLTSLTIPAGVTSIGGSAFRECGLTAFGVAADNANYKSVDGLLFTKDDTTVLQCPQTKTGSVSLPTGLTTISDGAFYGCTGLTSLSLPTNLTTIGNNAFQRCTGLASLTIPAGVTTIGNAAFAGCTGLTRVTIPAGVTTISDGAFYGCTGLASLSLPANLTTIGAQAFRGCTGLTSLTLPAGVDTIGYAAFNGCRNLSSLYFLGNAPNYVDNDAFVGVSASITYLTGTTGWGNPFFGLNAVSVASIASSSGDFGCSISKDAVTITSYTGSGGAVTIPDTIFGLPVTTIGISAFEGCAGLTSLTFPAGVTTIGDYAFYVCTGLTSLTLPERVTTIGDAAFANCTGLTSLSLPATVTSIGYSAFVGCSKLTRITMEAGNTSYKTVGSLLLTADGTTVVACAPAATGAVEIPAGVTTICDSAFYSCRGLTSLSLPANLTTIGAFAFYGCTGLTSLSLPTNLTTIGDYAFFGCTGLTSLSLPTNLTTIGNNAFQGCTGLTSLTFPAGVTTIGNAAFANCTGLTSLYFLGNAPPRVGTDAFFGVSATIHYLAIPAAIGVADGVTALTSAQAQAVGLGAAAVGATALKTFTVTNSGDAPLSISGVTLPAGVKVVQALPASILGGRSANLVVALDTAAVKSVSGSIAIASDASGSPFSIPVAGVVFGKPDLPTRVVSAWGNGTKIILSWTAAINNGSPVTTSAVYALEVGTTAWVKVADVAGTATSTEVFGLDITKAFAFKVASKNAAGFSKLSNDGVKYLMAPRTPAAIVAAAAGTGAATLTWQHAVQPEDKITKLFRPLTGYVVFTREVGAVAWTRYADLPVVTSTDVTGLVVGKTYQFSLRAKSDSGGSLISKPSNSLKV